ncbi:MAG: NADH-quinone oxidoreductase subunit [Thermodesulfobacteriota bacterium]|nr:NADH-quinone oxidoreductase subunit [Thermodesulfobacteriota bacterium]
MTKKDELRGRLRALFPEESFGVDEAYRTGVAFSTRVPAERLRDAAEACNETGFYLESITGLDFQDTAELVYHLNCYEPKSRVALRVLLHHDQTLLTLSDIFPSALWLEREVHDFFGISFTEHPDLRPLLLPEDADYHPLQKAFGKVNAYHERKEIYG